MNLVDVIKLYLFANTLLLVSYLAFAALRKSADSLKLVPNHKHLIAIGQALIIFSISAPTLLHSIPSQKLPKIEWTSFRPLSEDTGLADTQKQSRRTLDDHLKSSEALIIEPSLTDRAPPSVTLLLFLLTGSLTCVARLLRNYFRLKNLIQDASPIRTLGQVSIVISDLAVVPFSTRIRRRSWVVLPANILQRANDFRLAVRHELQHHRQRDTVWANFIEILICFFFANPAIFLWKREIIELQEFLCDEALISHKRISSHEYGICLVRVAETALRAHPIYAGTTCMAATFRNPFYFKSLLRRRIEMFANHKKPRSTRWAGGLIGIAAVTLTIALAYGAEQSMRKNEIQPVNPGVAVVDPTIQKIAEAALGEAIKAQKAKGGFAIVAEPSSGKILAVANIDPTNKLSGRWALGQALEPASIAKTLVAAQAIESGLTTPQEKHLCENGNYRYGGRIYHDWKEGGWNQLTTEETIAFSGDICAIKIGEKVGAEGLVRMLNDFGFGPEGTAKSFPEARPGVLPPLGNPYYPDVVPSVSAGFGFKATPIELVQAYGAIANGGNLMRPLSANANPSEGQVIRRVLSPKNAETVKVAPDQPQS